MSRKHGDWPLWEVFIRSRQGLSHKHVGSLHAADEGDGVGKCEGRLHTATRRIEHLGGAR